MNTEVQVTTLEISDKNYFTDFILNCDISLVNIKKKLI